MLEITVQIKQVYGRETIYPICPKALLFAKIKGQKTLTIDDISIIKQLGYKIIVKQNETTL